MAKVAWKQIALRLCELEIAMTAPANENFDPATARQKYRIGLCELMQLCEIRLRSEMTVLPELSYGHIPEKWRLE